MYTKKEISLIVMFMIASVWGLFCVVDESLSEAESQSSELSSMVTALMESAYFDGQKDAIHGDVRIIKHAVKDCYVWKKSPWNGKEVESTDCIDDVNAASTKILAEVMGK